jgi:outer membrane protein assembly factor BamB
MRTRTVLGAVAGVAVVAAVAAVAVPVVRHSDAFTTTIRTAATSPAAPETAPLPATVRQLWSVPTGASAAPVEGPSVIETGPNRVAGLDPATGLERWSYERGNATLCGATRQDGLVLVLFAKSHGCRDLTALDAATGARRWYRTLELTTGATLTSGPGVLVATGANQMVAVDTGGGLNRWTYSAAAGCVLDPAVIGRAAVATVSRCPGSPNQLVVHQPFIDKAPWTSPLQDGADPHVLTAETLVTVLAGNTLSLFSTKQDDDGKITASPAGDVVDDRLLGSGTPAAVVDADFLVVWTGTDAAGVDTRNKDVLWRAAATGPPALAEGQVLLAAPAGFTLRPAATGKPVTPVLTGNGVPAGAGLSRIGRLVIVAGDGRLVGYG